MNASPIYCLRLFGSPSVATGEGTRLGGPATQRHRLALLALLVLSPGQGLSRDKLMAYLWPERDSEHARHLLNQGVYRLRKVLGEEALLSDGDDLRLDPELIQGDVLEFEAALSRGDPEAAVALYRGALLDGFFLNDSPEFERWVERERERLASAYARALEGLAEAAEGEQDYRSAAEWWKALAAQDPYDSGIVLRLMQALATSGNPAGALQHARVHRQLLEDEVGMEAPAELLALADRLRTEPPEPLEPPHRSARPPARYDHPPGDATEADRATTPAAPLLTPPERPRPRRHGRFALAAFAMGAILLAAALLRPARNEPAGATPDVSVAVLPLANLSTDPADAVLAAAMTQELISMLARVDGLRVIPSASVSGFGDQRLDARSIADSLRVGHLLEGGLQKAGSRLRVNLRLVDGRGGSTRWSATYDREFRDVFAMQNEIAQAVAHELGLQLGVRTGLRARPAPTQNVAAYELYLRGSDPALYRTAAGRRLKLELFAQAIALDSTYVAPHVGLASVYLLQAMFAASPARDALVQAEGAARRALALDEALAVGHLVLGAIHMSRFEYATAEQRFERAIALDSMHAEARGGLVKLQIWTGRPAAALGVAARALELDPLSPAAHAEYARALAANGRCGEALKQLEEILALQPPLLRAGPIAAQCLVQVQKWTEAIAAMRPAQEERAPRGQALLGYLLVRAGQPEKARAIRDSLLEAWRQGNGDAFALAIVHLGFGEVDQAFDWIDRAIDDLSLLPSLGGPSLLDPVFAELHQDPRFERVRERLGLSGR